MFRLMVMTLISSVKGVADERQAKKYLGTKRKISVQEEALHLEKRKIKRMEERLKKKSKTDEDCTFITSLLPSIQKTGRHTKIGTQNVLSEQRSQENSNL